MKRKQEDREDTKGAPILAFTLCYEPQSISSIIINGLPATVGIYSCGQEIPEDVTSCSLVDVHRRLCRPLVNIYGTHGVTSQKAVLDNRWENIISHKFPHFVDLEVNHYIHKNPSLAIGHSPDRHAGYVGCEVLTAVVMKIEATCSSETSVAFQQTTRRYIPDDRTFYVRFILKYLGRTWGKDNSELNCIKHFLI
jgi:hypothetical protein